MCRSRHSPAGRPTRLTDSYRSRPGAKVQSVAESSYDAWIKHYRADENSPNSSWLRLVSHELFHAWNVKRLRPIELGPFDYENEIHTASLWVVEGLTSYYGDLGVKQLVADEPQPSQIAAMRGGGPAAVSSIATRRC